MHKPFFLILTVCIFWTCTLKAQIISVSQKTAFSAESIQDVQTRLDSLNQESSYRVYIQLSLISLNPVKVDFDTTRSTSEFNSLEEWIKATQITKDSSLYEFESYERITQQAITDFLSKDTSDVPIIVLSHTIGRYFSPTQIRHHEKTHLLFQGVIPEEIQKQLQAFTPSSSIDMGAENRNSNDAWLREWIDFLDYTLKEDLENDITLENIRFLNNFPLEGESIPQWQAGQGNAQKQAICYHTGQEALVQPVFRYDKKPKKDLQIRIKALGQDNTVAAQIDEEGKRIYTNEALRFRLGEQVDFLESLQILWEISQNGGKSWEIVGISSIPVYVVLRQPQNVFELEEKMLYFSCTKARGVKTHYEVIQKIWQPFAHQRVMIQDFDPTGRLPAKQLTYYANIEPKYTGTDILDSSPADGHYYLDGECGSFADLFTYLLLHQGVFADRRTYASKYKGEKFMVRNWAFEGKGSYAGEFYSHVNEAVNGEVINVGITQRRETVTDLLPDIRRAGHRYEWVATEVKDLPGIAGQGVSNPYSDFGSHYVVEANGRIYDPSYGKVYASRREWEEKAIAAFWVFEVRTIKGKRHFFMYLRVNSGAIEDIKE